MAAPVSVLGRDLVVERVWSRRPRIVHQGQELPRDRWGSPVLIDENGRSHQVQASFSWRQLSPVVEVDGHQSATWAPLPVAARVVLLAFIAVGLLGGLIGVLLSVGAALVSAALLRRPGRRAAHVVAAVLVPLIAVVVFVLVAVWVQ
ncbi:hypothetical protein [Kineococcus sp. SYSU DK001]|uniref:hypothetical protein n=1 Tax=Kineococcus sp. SYSU DK001 TaxID=3383122 RepID=UPI003D7D32C5